MLVLPACQEVIFTASRKSLKQKRLPDECIKFLYICPKMSDNVMYSGCFPLFLASRIHGRLSCLCFQWFALRTPTEPVSDCLTKWLFFVGFCLFSSVTGRLIRRPADRASRRVSRRCPQRHVATNGDTARLETRATSLVASFLVPRRLSLAFLFHVACRDIFFN